MNVRSSKFSLPCSLPQGWTSSHTLHFARGCNLGMIDKPPGLRSTILPVVRRPNWIFQQSSFDIFTLSLRPRESTGNIAAKGGEHWSTFCTRNTDCKFLHASDSSSKRVGSFHDNGPGRLEISAACTSTYGCHAARNSLHHVLLDVIVQLCDEHRQTKNRVQRSCLVNCTHHARRRCLGTPAENSCHLE